MSAATPGSIAGYAALYNRPTVIGAPKAGYGFRETIASGAFSGVLNDGSTYAAFNHDPSLLLARLSAGNLRLRSDSKGLAYEVDLPHTTLGRDVGWMVARGMVLGSSFAFRVAEGGDRWSRGKDGLDERVIYRVERLVDVSPVTSPAYEDTATEGALAPVAAGRGAVKVQDRRLAAAERQMRAEQERQDLRLRLALAEQGLAPTGHRTASGAPERRLVPVGAIERRWVAAALVVR